MVGVLGFIVVCGVVFYSLQDARTPAPTVPLDVTPQEVTLSGTYVCLPHTNTEGPQTMECAFGLETDDGEFYAVNFGQAADNYEWFKSGTHITAKGFVVLKEALSSDYWSRYTMKGIFTITTFIEPN